MNGGAAVYARQNRRKYIILTLIALVGLLALVVDVMTGAAMLPVGEVLEALFSRASVEPTTRVIVWNMRLPVALMALVVGFALGSSGAVMRSRGGK